jgi:hypothetical protein
MIELYLEARWGARVGTIIKALLRIRKPKDLAFSGRDSGLTVR